MATRLPGHLAGLVVPPPTVAARVERVFLEREVAGGQRLSARALAAELEVERAERHWPATDPSGDGEAAEEGVA